MEQRPGWSPPARARYWGGGSDPVGETADGTATAEDNGRVVVIHLDGGSKGDGGVLDNGGIRQAVP